MGKSMKLYLKNIGKIDEATVEIDGITVIAGENDTGKSTVGKALFSVFNSCCGIDELIKSERTKSVEKIIARMQRNEAAHSYLVKYPEDAARDLLLEIELLKDNSKLIREEVVKWMLQYNQRANGFLNDDNIDGLALQIEELLNIPDEDILKLVLEKNLKMEFNGQISNIYAQSMSEIRLQIKDKEMTITIEDNSVKDTRNHTNLHTEAVYLDDPFILDEPRYPFTKYKSNYMNHRMRLKNNILYGNGEEPVNIVEELVVNNKFKKIYEKIGTVCDGNFVIHKVSGIGYRGKNSDKTLDVRNLSTGLKTFAILKMLLQNGMIEYNGTIILDEPEFHLHPEWQLLFAELIVLLHKEFSMHILLNTHSPYFLRAIQVYSARYGTADRCRYYLSEAEGNYAYISDVTDDVEKIYSKLSRPLQRLENERWQDD